MEGPARTLWGIFFVVLAALDRCARERAQIQAWLQQMLLRAALRLSGCGSCWRRFGRPCLRFAIVSEVVERRLGLRYLHPIRRQPLLLVSLQISLVPLDPSSRRRALRHDQEKGTLKLESSRAQRTHLENMEAGTCSQR